MHKASFNEMNISEILSSPMNRDPQIRKDSNEQYIEEESNLLNMSQTLPLECYISGKKAEESPNEI